MCIFQKLKFENLPEEIRYRHTRYDQQIYGERFRREQATKNTAKNAQYHKVIAFPSVKKVAE